MRRASLAFDGYPRVSVQDQDLSGYGTNGKGVQFRGTFSFRERTVQHSHRQASGA
jgi:hypothetical protein